MHYAGLSFHAGFLVFLRPQNLLLFLLLAFMPVVSYVYTVYSMFRKTLTVEECVFFPLNTT